ncbi:MAG: preprotein translocase subunit SecG [Mycoplasma sp.]
MSITVILLIISFVVILIGLLLSSSGASAGLSNISAQDLEIFKKTKDRGIVKMLQVIFVIILVIIAALIITFSIIKI